MNTGFSLRGLSWWVVLGLVTFMTVIRFVGLEKSPPGFFFDEAYISTHVICLAQTSHDSDGKHMPLFSDSGGGGQDSPTHVYPASLWVQIFGYSIGSLRAYAGFIISLALIGLFFVGRLFMDNRGAFYVALAGCLSPWLFQFARMAVDDPETYLCGLTWGMFFFLRSEKLRDAVLAAALFSMAAYAYPAGRICLPFLFFALLPLRIKTKGVTPAYLILFFVVGTLLCFPMIVKTINGDLMSRYAVVGILAPGYRDQIGANSFLGAIWVFIKNVATHFNPNYLFFHGDQNLRHNSQFSGELSWLDDLALVMGVVLLVQSCLKDKKFHLNRFVVFCLAGIVIGTFSAAMTWESLPHSLRSAATWPFVALLSGYIIYRSEQRWRLALAPFALVSIFFTYFFLHHYFTVYPSIAEPWFDSDVKAMAIHARDSGDWAQFREHAKKYDHHAGRYYAIAYGGQTCDSSDQFLSESPGQSVPQTKSNMTK